MTSETPAQRLGRLVLARRKALKLTQADVQNLDGPSTATLRLIESGNYADFRGGTAAALERALGWDVGSINAILAGEDATISGVIRGRDGRVIQKFTRIDDGTEDQDEDIEVLRLAALIMDARDMVRSPTGPLTTALAIVMDEAAELATRAVARSMPGGDDIDDAKWRIDQVRAGGSIRRQGSVYITDNEGDRDDLENAPESTASAEGQQDQEAGADDGEEAVRATSRTEPPPDKPTTAAGRTRRALRRQPAEKRQN